MSAIVGFLGALLVMGAFAICLSLLNRWRHQPALPEPNRVATDYSSDERLRLQQTFQRIASRYRRRTRIAVTAGILLSVCFIAQFIFVRSLPQKAEVWLPYFLGGIIVGLILLVLLQPRFPVCPECHGRLDGRLGHYCPSCGRRQLRGDSYQAHCEGCGESLDLSWREGGRGRHRHYRIRSCTRCGLLIDQKGL